MADGASNNDTMAQVMSELLFQFETTDRGRCLNHVLHLSAMRILNPFDAKPGQLDRALAEAMRELDTVSDDLTSLGDAEEEGEDGTGGRVEAEEEEERQFRDIAADLAADLSTNERAELAASCMPGATALSKVCFAYHLLYYPSADRLRFVN